MTRADALIFAEQRLISLIEACSANPDEWLYQHGVAELNTWSSIVQTLKDY